MRVETDIKLGFKDVLIRPKRSNLKSRAQVELNRTYTFLHSGRTWTGIPVIAAHMDTVGTFEAAEVLAGFGLLTAIHKHYSLEEWEAAVSDATDHYQDQDNTSEYLLAHPMVSDDLEEGLIAHGYSCEE